MRINATWHLVEDDLGACLIREGGNPNVVADRYAFIEKTPRIRIRHHYPDSHADYLNWASGGKGSGVHDKESREWCEKALELFGHTLIRP